MIAFFSLRSAEGDDSVQLWDIRFPHIPSSPKFPKALRVVLFPKLAILLKTLFTTCSKQVENPATPVEGLSKRTVDF